MLKKKSNKDETKPEEIQAFMQEHQCSEKEAANVIGGLRHLCQVMVWGYLNKKNDL